LLLAVGKPGAPDVLRRQRRRHLHSGVCGKPAVDAGHLKHIAARRPEAGAGGAWAGALAGAPPWPPWVPGRVRPPRLAIEAQLDRRHSLTRVGTERATRLAFFRGRSEGLRSRVPNREKRFAPHDTRGPAGRTPQDDLAYRERPPRVGRWVGLQELRARDAL